VPKYTFECQTEGCGLRFERTLKVGEHPAHECPACHEDAPQVIEGFAFAFKVGEGQEGNSGVHKEDYPTADQAVGRDAERKWETMGERSKVKAKVREVGKTGALIRKDGETYTDYEAMTPAKQAAHKHLAHRADLAIQAAQKARQTR
jgi:putative FmdB family regulatory protein